jgi:hypothetical protein
MTSATSTELELLRTRVSGAVGRQMPEHIGRLGWDAGQLAACQRDRLRALLARAIAGSPFHARRLRGVDPDRFELADLARLPVMTKAEMMQNFDAATTDRRVTRDLVERHLARAVTNPSLLLGDYVVLVSGGSSGQRGLFVQTADEYAEFAASVTRRHLAATMAAEPARLRGHAGRAGPGAAGRPPEAEPALGRLVHRGGDRRRLRPVRGDGHRRAEPAPGRPGPPAGRLPPGRGAGPRPHDQQGQAVHPLVRPHTMS